MTNPLKGDRAAHDSVNYPALHAKDLEDNTPIQHLPAPTTADQVPVSDGEKWVATDASSLGGGGGGTVAYTHWDADAPPETPSAMDDEFDDYSIDAKWNQIVSMYTTTSGSYSTPSLDVDENQFGFVFEPIYVIESIQGFVQGFDIDVGDEYLVTLKVAKSGGIGEVGIVFQLTDATDELHTFGIKWSPIAVSAIVQNWTNWITKNGAASADVSLGSGFSHYYLRIYIWNNSSGELANTYMVSSDGTHWTTIHSGTISESFVYLGFYCNVNGTTYNVQSFVEFFRVREVTETGLTDKIQLTSYGDELDVLT